MNLGNDLYFLHPYVSNSALGKYSGKYKPNYVLAYALGTLLDAMITTPELVDFIQLRVFGYDFQFTKEHFDLCRRMRDAARKHPFILELLKICQGQQEFYVQGIELEWDGFSFFLNGKAKYDLWSYVLGWGADIKTTSATTQEGFIRDCYAFDYDRQRAWYMKIAQARQDVLIGISKEWPYKVFVHRIIQGDAFHTSGLHKINECGYLLARAN